jgi:hypothetical protein
MLRSGVAFSFETSRSLPTIDVLIPKVKLFNDFMRLYPDLYADMRMWHWRNGRSTDYPPGPISPELVAKGVFVFLGKIRPVENLDYDAVLADMDRLLPLYKYVESDGEAGPLSVPGETRFNFRAGCAPKLSATTASYAERALDVNLRHNLLQVALYRNLVAEYGPDNVGTEVPTGVGTIIDLVVRRPNDYWFFEIKTFESPRACIREALGQLLEYAFWPGSSAASRFVVVGESPIDNDVLEYCRRLRERFSLPIEYLQLALESV